VSSKAKKVLRFAKGTVKAIFIVLLIFVASLFFRDQRIPKSWVDKACDRISCDGLLVRCERAAFGFRGGLDISGVRVYDCGESNAVSTIASAGWVRVNPFTRRITVFGAKYLRLPDSYYAPEFSERNLDCDIELRDVPEFDLVLERPQILGIEPESASGRVKISRRAVTMDNIHVVWPERKPRMSVTGGLRVDFISQRFAARLRGTALQHHIRPHLVALDIPCALPYFDAFTQVVKPIPVQAEFDVNLRNLDFDMKLWLRPELGRYNGVRMSRANGEIDVSSRIRGTNCNAFVKIDLPVAVDPNGRKLAGALDITSTNDLPRVNLDVRSDLALSDILAISDFLDPSLLDFIVCETAPTVIARGHFGTDLRDIEWNDIEGSVHIPRATLQGLKLHNCEFDYDFKRDILDFKRVRAVGKKGGSFTCTGRLDFNDFKDETNVAFSVTTDYKHGELDELSDLMDMALAGRSGKVNAHIEMSGIVGTNTASRLNGAGSVTVAEGHLLQMNLFAGLTSLLAEKVPGVSYIVNQTDASADFTVSNGVMRTENLYLEGGLLSLKGYGSYDIGADDLDLVVRVQFMKKESLMGKLIHPITFPFTKLLLEFKASGSAGDPKWDYVSILDRVF